MSDDKQILMHALGIRKPNGRPYRNHFVTGEGSDDYPICMALVARGLMVKRKGSELTGGDDVFFVTDAGRDFAQAESKK